MDFDLEEFLPYRLHQVAERTSQKFHRFYEEHYKLSRNGWRVLFHIGSSGPISTTEISRKSRLDKAIISREVHKLEDRNWAKRQSREHDRRGNDILLTKEGRLIFREIRKLALKFNEEIATNLEENLTESLLEALKRLEAFAPDLPE